MTARLLFVSTGLNTGGAETVLYRLLSRLDRERYEPHVVSLTETGTVGQRLTSLGIPVSAIQMGSAGRSVLGWVRLVRHVRRLRPDLVQTWMYHADLFGGLAARMGGAGRVVWGLRQSDLDRNFVKRSTFWTVRLCALLSRTVPDKILCCSWATQCVHAELGYDSSKMLVIPNGFDTDHFRPSDRARLEIREELSLPPDATLIGLIARFDPQKDHKTFIAAADQLGQSYPNVRFLLCGDGVDSNNEALVAWIAETAIGDRFHLLGPRADIPRLTASLDIATSSSAYGEGFPNVIGEAMACGVCCVAADVGDSRRLLEDVGWVVPPRDSAALSEAWASALDTDVAERNKRGQAAREKIEKEFRLDDIVGQYEEIYASLLEAKRAAT